MAKKASKSSAQPATTAQQLGSLVKSARDIMRKDKGLNGDLDRLPMLTWIMFLKFLDDMEQMREQEAKLEGVRFRPAISSPYRWRDWAAQDDGITGPELIAFINQDEAVRPDGSKGPGLFAHLRTLQSAEGRGREEVIANVFRGVVNRMESGYLLRDVINKVGSIHFTSSEEIHTLSRLYESMLREMRDAAGDSGEFYTPRSVVQFMVAVTNPQLGETVLDPACGTGGFLVEAFEHLSKQCKTVQDRRKVQQSSIFGQEAKSLPYMLAQMNLLLHGLEHPHIDYGNSLTLKVTEIGDKDRVDVVLTNPPFGGEEEAQIKNNFPADLQTAETALLFLQLIMRKLRRPEKNNGKPGRAAVVVPNGTLFGDGVCGRIKEQMLLEFNLHTIVRLPNGVFAPYTSIPTNLLFFDRSGPTKDLWFYEVPLPEGRKNYSKTKPMQFEEFADTIKWFNAKRRQENDHAWRIDFKGKHADAVKRATPHWKAADEAATMAAGLEADAKKIEVEVRKYLDEKGAVASLVKKMQDEVRAMNERRKELLSEAGQHRIKERQERAAGDAIYWPIFNLDVKNPNSTEGLEHLPPEQLAADILDKERQIIGIIEEIKAELEGVTA